MSTHKTAVIGLGAMGMGMAQSAYVAGLQTVGMDINPAAMASLAAAGATVAETPAKAAAGADSLAVVVVKIQKMCCLPPTPSQKLLLMSILVTR